MTTQQAQKETVKSPQETDADKLDRAISLIHDMFVRSVADHQMLQNAGVLEHEWRERHPSICMRLSEFMHGNGELRG